MNNFLPQIQQQWSKARPFVITLAGLVVLIAMVRWGGTAKPGPLLVAGIALQLGVLALYGLVGYWLYLSPLPLGTRVTATGSSEIRRLVSLFIPIAGMLFVSGGVWDEAWHMRFGGFGNDFLWPPHFLMYSSLGMIALIALGSVVMLLLRGGDIRARFRAEPLIGITGLVACMLVTSLPVDQLWHTVYGVDITAWSLPHIWIVVGFLLVMASAISLQLSFVPRGPWRGFGSMRWQEWLVIVQIVCGASGLYQLGTAEWDGVTEIPARLATGVNSFRDAFWSRPEWLYPVVLAALALFCTNLALHALRRAGVATCVLVLVAVYRTGAAFVLGRFGGSEIAIRAYWLLIPAAIALDLWYASRLRHAERTSTLVIGNLIASVALLLVDLPVIATNMVYPRVNASTLPWMLVMSVAGGMAFGWVGARLGDWVASRERLDVANNMTTRSRWLATATGLAAIAFALLVIVTARPPTA